MVQTEALVTEIGRNGPFVQVVLDVPEIAPGLSPGRFVMADLGAPLRASLFPAWMEAGEFAALVPPDHLAAALRPGARLDIIGPLGRGYEAPEEKFSVTVCLYSEFECYTARPDSCIPDENGLMVDAMPTGSELCVSRQFTIPDDWGRTITFDFEDNDD